MMPKNAVTIVLLAGGRSTRLPGKLELAIGGEFMLVKVFRQLTSTGRPCVISVREPLGARIRQRLQAPTVNDAYQDGGPLGGLASAAAHVRTPLLFAAAGDLPNIDAGAIDAVERRYLEAARASGPGPDAVLPRHGDGEVEPLAALYDTAALLRNATQLLARGQKKITQALEGLRLTYYDIPEAEEHKYLNINTAADLASLRNS